MSLTLNENKMTYSASILSASIKESTKMDCTVRPYGEDVTFYGSELACYKLAYALSNKECKVQYSENLSTWCVSVYDYFSTSMAQRIEA